MKLEHGITGTFAVSFEPKLEEFRFEPDGFLEHEVTGDFEVIFHPAKED